MKLFLFIYSLLIFSTNCFGQSLTNQNPFFTEYDTPFETPPFDLIKTHHFKPAFDSALRILEIELEKIINNDAEPTFENTILGDENSGELLTKVATVFFTYTYSKANDTLLALEKEFRPKIIQVMDETYQNAKLFERVKYLEQNKDELDLNKEQKRLIEIIYRRFLNNGVNLPIEKKERLREINRQLSLLESQFRNNILKEENDYELVVEDENQLAGLPQEVIEAAAEASNARNLDRKWVFTLHSPSYQPFIKFSDRRELREKMYLAHSNRGNNNNEWNTQELIREILDLRLEKAEILGYSNFAAYALHDRMAENPENVIQLLDQILEPALKVINSEAEQIKKLMSEDGLEGDLQPWDWNYCVEKIKDYKYDLKEDEIKPYFQLKNVRDGAFEVANKLFGLQFTQRNDIQVYHSEVEVFEVKDENGKHVGILYLDYFPSENKNSGAWARFIRFRRKINDELITPLVLTAFNFTRPGKAIPSLLTLEEVKIFFHEIGHALNYLLSQVNYPTLQVSIPRDFIEFHSQLMENWAVDPVVMNSYARHYQTGAIIPEHIIENISNASKFNQGYQTLSYLASAYLDLKWHLLEEKFTGNVVEKENEWLQELGLPPVIGPRHRTTHFKHSFCYSYAAAYYCFIWAEMLVSDAFAYFKQTDIFDRMKADKLKRIYANGNLYEPMDSYIQFRGKEPDMQALMEKRGLTKAEVLSSEKVQ
jgi:peptidyl-dipeptidase Dcp